ncbi:LOW QUALITY PROTEIN: nuclear transcription factor Y subunit beta [Triticum aestivum]|uniref:LOW QUALITY PROTEIN: nuclear transcription factor Y subunit beta n=1 Tax=Triticum aestivum TaxID=4565 RepID=UPI001D014950|nr:LOW QUALITY PROTEIN: nuclear transcription factor Y subunit beta [Triticum aestivum]
MDPMDIVGKSKEDVSLPKSTMTKIIKEMLPPDVRVARDTQDLLVECCVEFINLLSSESNDVCSRDDKKTIAPEHVIRALQDLGFKEYVEEVYAAYEQHKLETLDSPKATKFTGIEMTEEEAVAEQQRMFAEARARMNNGAAKPKEPALEPQNQPQQPPQPHLQLHPQAQQPPQPQPQLHYPQSQQPLQPFTQAPPQQPLHPQLQQYTQAPPQQPLQPPLQLYPQAQPEQPLQPQSSGSTTGTCVISAAAPSATGTLLLQPPPQQSPQSQLQLHQQPQPTLVPPPQPQPQPPELQQPQPLTQLQAEHGLDWDS